MPVGLVPGGGGPGTGIEYQLASSPGEGLETRLECQLASSPGEGGQGRGLNTS